MCWDEARNEFADDLTEGRWGWGRIAGTMETNAHSSQKANELDDNDKDDYHVTMGMMIKSA